MQCGRPPTFWALDLHYVLNCEDLYWDGAFTERTFEYLSPNEGKRLLGELKRTPRLGAFLRVIVPDLQKYVRNYLGDVKEGGFALWPSGAEALESLSQGWGHRSLWDAGLLCRELRTVGFADVTAVDFRQGRDGRLLMDSESRKWESVWLEAQKQ